MRKEIRDAMIDRHNKESYNLPYKEERYPEESWLGALELCSRSQVLIRRYLVSDPDIEIEDISRKVVRILNKRLSLIGKEQKLSLQGNRALGLYRSHLLIIFNHPFHQNTLSSSSADRRLSKRSRFRRAPFEYT